MKEIFTIANTSNLDLNVFQYGYEYCAPQHSFGPAIRQHFLFHYVVSGTGVFYTDQGTFQINAGQGFLIFPQDITIYTADKNKPWYYMWIEVDGYMASKFFEECNLTRQFPVYKPEIQSENSNEYCRLKDLMINDLPWLDVLGLTYLFFSALMGNSKERIKEKVNPVDKHLLTAVKYIESQYNTNVSIESVANYCHLNPSYMSRIFKDKYGISPKEYLLEFRMKIAAGLLSNSDTPIKVISISVGYENQLHFSKSFRKLYGMSPTEWRNKHN